MIEGRDPSLHLHQESNLDFMSAYKSFKKIKFF